jgi:cysteine desulfurase
VISAIEHPSVLKAAIYWCEQLGHELCLVQPDATGQVDVERFCQQLDKQTIMACLMWANNETGVIQPVEDVVKACREKHIPVLIDAVQAMGKIPLDLNALGADFVSLSAHKIGGMKGVGALAIRRGSALETWAVGGGQERGRRSGTENVAGVASFSAALGIINYADIVEIRDAFERYLLEKMPDVSIYGQDVNRVANTSMFTVPKMDGETLLMQLDLAGFAVASGSACSSGKREPSHVLRAMGVAEKDARSSLRVSFGAGHGVGDAKALVDELVRIRALLQKMAGFQR